MSGNPSRIEEAFACGEHLQTGPRRPPSPRPGPGDSEPPALQRMYAPYDYRENCSFCGTRQPDGAGTPPLAGVTITREPRLAPLRRFLRRVRAWLPERWRAGRAL